jgi:hypothetical protein
MPLTISLSKRPYNPMTAPIKKKGLRAGRGTEDVHPGTPPMM